MRWKPCRDIRCSAVDNFASDLSEYRQVVAAGLQLAQCRRGCVLMNAGSSRWFLASYMAGCRVFGMADTVVVGS